MSDTLKGKRKPPRKEPALAETCCGLFAGIGGLEVGLHRAGYLPRLLCEIDPDATAVLRERFPGVQLHGDVRTLDGLPTVDVVAAGFPCQDLSMAGNKAGIHGSRSNLVTSLFALLRRMEKSPRWLVMENVPYMLSLDGGRAMAFLTRELEAMGFRWAYRVLDARAFGIPQRRLRVVLVASKEANPCGALFVGDETPDHDDSTQITNPDIAYGFYWTEGKRGLGWTVDGVPTIKGGSTIGIPSAPAIWDRPQGLIGTPDIRDVERLQGFQEDWTASAPSRARWRLLGNAVCVPMAEWVGERLRLADETFQPVGTPFAKGRWPRAAYGAPGEPPRAVDLSSWPVRHRKQSLRDFLRYPLQPLSERATAGYLKRTSEATSLNFPPGFLEAVRLHLRTVSRRDDARGRRQMVV